MCPLDKKDRHSSGKIEKIQSSILQEENDHFCVLGSQNCITKANNAGEEINARSNDLTLWKYFRQN